MVELPQKIKYKKSDLKEKISTLNYMLRILSVSDAIILPEYKVERKTTEEILELILDKLFELYDDNFHSVEMILWGNGVETKRHDEARQFAKILERNGYVEIRPSRQIVAKLTLDGKMYVENRKKRETIDYSKISDSQKAIDEKIDEVLNELNKLGLGQEILFDELNELKVLYSKLSKKNWGQLLKGKIVDLGLSQVVNNDVLGKIYEEKKLGWSLS